MNRELWLDRRVRLMESDEKREKEKERIFKRKIHIREQNRKLRDYGKIDKNK